MDWREKQREEIAKKKKSNNKKIIFKKKHKNKPGVGGGEEEQAKAGQGLLLGSVKSQGACRGGGERSTDQHFPQAWAQACETPRVLKNLGWDLLRTNAVMC